MFGDYGEGLTNLSLPVHFGGVGVGGGGSVSSHVSAPLFRSRIGPQWLSELR